tara:strand:+ start:3011 stop:3718 length:708 start_codon:yes stop_codon:yes gene_type:complete
LKVLIKKFLESFGYKISKYDTFSSIDIIKNQFDKKRDITIFDIGGHYGQSAELYRKLFKKALIYSFEPYPESYKVLSSLKIDNFKTYNIGFSDKPSRQKLLINENKTSTNSILPFSRSANKVWGLKSLENSKGVFCDFDTVDNFCSKRKINQIDFMKIDVQGAEYLVLEGAKKALLNKDIKLIQLEVISGDTYIGQKSIGFYINLLESYGYKLKNFSDSIVKKGILVQTDLFFIA